MQRMTNNKLHWIPHSEKLIEKKVKISLYSSLLVQHGEKKSAKLNQLCIKQDSSYFPTVVFIQICAHTTCKENSQCIKIIQTYKWISPDMLNRLVEEASRMQSQFTIALGNGPTLSSGTQCGTYKSAGCLWYHRMQQCGHFKWMNVDVTSEWNTDATSTWNMNATSTWNVDVTSTWKVDATST